MKNSKLVQRVGAFALAVGIGVAAQADVLSDAKERGYLTVGTEMQYAPYDFIENGVQVGFNADLFAEIGKELGLEVRHTDLPWPSVLPGLSSAKFDMVGGPVTIRAERTKNYSFTVPVGQSGFTLVTRAGEEELTSLSDIEGKVLGSFRGSSAMAATQALAEEYGAAEVREYIDASQGYGDLAAGRVIAIGNEAVNNGYTVSQRPEIFAVLPDSSYGEVAYVAYVARNDADSESLVAAVNEAIAAIKADGRFAEIQTKWLGAPVELPVEVDPANY